jgi:hypothetical protein
MCDSSTDNRRLTVEIGIPSERAARLMLSNWATLAKIKTSSRLAMSVFHSWKLNSRLSHLITDCKQSTTQAALGAEKENVFHPNTACLRLINVDEHVAASARIRVGRTLGIHATCGPADAHLQLCSSIRELLRIEAHVGNSVRPGKPSMLCILGAHPPRKQPCRRSAVFLRCLCCSAEAQCFINGNAGSPSNRWLCLRAAG